jgi:hypothetical protein
MNDCWFGYLWHCRYLTHGDRAPKPSAAETTAHKIAVRKERFLPDQQAVILAVRARLQVRMVHCHPFPERWSRAGIDDVDSKTQMKFSFERGEVGEKLANFVPSSNQGGAAGGP